MRIKYTHIPVIDVECTCYENNDWPDGEVQEIIEIGVALLNLQTLEVEKIESILIPPVESTIGSFCTKLTTLRPDMFDPDTDYTYKLWSFQDACGHLYSRYLTNDRPWASWGDFDRSMFEEQCARRAVRYPFRKTHLNVKALFSMFTGNPQGLGMTQALKVAKLKLKGTHHRGHDDAANIARILAWVFQHRNA